MISTFTIVLFATSLMVLFSAAAAWRRRDAPGGSTLTLMLLAVFIWCFFSAMETTSRDAVHRYLWSALSYIGIYNAPPLLLVFALQYSDSPVRLGPLTLCALWLVPAAVIVLAFTNGLHHLVWTGFAPGPVAGTNTVIYYHGAGFYAGSAYLFVLSLLGSAQLVRVAVRAARLYVLQSVLLVAAVAIPWVGVALFDLPRGPFPGLDTASLGFAVSAVLMVTLFNRLRFMDLVPRARASLMERLQAGVLILDIQDRVVDANEPARGFAGGPASLIGRRLAELFPVLETREGTQALRTESPRPGTALEASISPLLGRSGRRTGSIVLLRDVTERRRAEEEREKLVAELTKALAEVKKLSGLLPICASCKKIRDDKGYWHQVETYVHAHAEVEFSHSLCPECIRKLYPELADP